MVRSVLNGDLTCEYEIMIPEEIMKTENEYDLLRDMGCLDGGGV